jgi:hypothetical protein
MACSVGLPDAACAHDTWFRRLGAPSANILLLELGTGNRPPHHEFPIGPEQLAKQGCMGPRGVARMQPVRVQQAALLLRFSDPEAAQCWAELVPFEVTVPPDKIAVYLDDIHADAELREHWRALSATGRSGSERYVKHARLLLHGNGVAGERLRMDIEQVSERVVSGELVHFRIWFENRPLPEQWLELVGDRGETGGWFRSSDDGTVTFAVPREGTWLLRGTRLRPSTLPGPAWTSDFVTLVFTAN